jgi:hypothetical protein
MTTMFGDGIIRWFPPLPDWDPNRGPSHGHAPDGASLLQMMAPALIVVVVLVLLAALWKIPPPRYPVRRRKDRDDA